ncbi:MAG: NrdJb, partial [Cellvibrionaceae bacterium]|nr:NrdJb [Cellvibrionaceae bacterium]
IETHLRLIGILEPEELGAEQKRILQEKHDEYKRRGGDSQTKDEGSLDFPADASMCFKCSTKAVIIMDGCKTCLNCGDSKCG